jgi:hypothetical protein
MQRKFGLIQLTRIKPLPLLQTLCLHRKVCSSSSSMSVGKSLPGVLRTCPEFLGNSPSMHSTWTQKAKLVKQPLRRFDKPKRKAIASQLHRLEDAGFIKEIKTSTWVSNPVLVPKKNTDMRRVCIEYTSLKKHCPKDPDEVLPLQCPCLRAFESWSEYGIRRTRWRSDNRQRHTKFYPGSRPLCGGSLHPASNLVYDHSCVYREPSKAGGVVLRVM